MDLDSVLVHEHARKELGQYPAILISHLVNNPDVFFGLQLDRPITRVVKVIRVGAYKWQFTVSLLLFETRVRTVRNSMS